MTGRLCHEDKPTEDVRLQLSRVPCVGEGVVLGGGARPTWRVRDVVTYEATDEQPEAILVILWPLARWVKAYPGTVSV